MNIPQGVAPLEDATDPTKPSVPLVEFFQTVINFPYFGLRDQSNRKRLRDSRSRAPNMWLTLEYSYGQERVDIQVLRIFNSGEYEVAISNVELYTEPLYNHFGPYRVSGNERRGTFVKPGATINVPLFPTTAPTSVGHPLLIPSGLYPWETAHIIVYLGTYPEGIKKVERGVSMFRLLHNLWLVVLLGILSSCVPEKPPAPALKGISDINRSIILSVGNASPEFKAGAPLNIAVVNKSEESVEFPSNYNLHLYLLTKKGWMEIPNRFHYSEQGPIILPPLSKGGLDQLLIFPLLPARVTLEDIVLRITIAGYGQDSRRKIGAYLDITLHQGK